MYRCWKKGLTVGLQLGHISATKQETATPISCRVWVIDAYGNGCNEVYGADSTETQGGGQWIVNEGMRDRKKKAHREDEREGHEFRKSTKCSGWDVHCLSHIKWYLLKLLFSNKKQRVKPQFSFKTFVFISASIVSLLSALPQEVHSFCRKQPLS
jgi:hypothetical protein